MVVASGDMNAQVGETHEGFEGVHEGMGFRKRNAEGERLLELAEASELILLNTLFKKSQNHLVTYENEQNQA